MVVPAPREPSARDVSSMQSTPLTRPKSGDSADSQKKQMFTWICLGCGYHHIDDVSPERCPRCTGTSFLSTSHDESGN